MDPVIHQMEAHQIEAQKEAQIDGVVVNAKMKKDTNSDRNHLKVILYVVKDGKEDEVQIYEVPSKHGRQHQETYQKPGQVSLTRYKPLERTPWTKQIKYLQNGWDKFQEFSEANQILEARKEQLFADIHRKIDELRRSYLKDETKRGLQLLGYTVEPVKAHTFVQKEAKTHNKMGGVEEIQFVTYQVPDETHITAYDGLGVMQPIQNYIYWFLGLIPTWFLVHKG